MRAQVVWLTFANNTTLCPEYRDLRWTTANECSMDHARGCQVCQCQPVSSEPSAPLPSGLAPDRR